MRYVEILNETENGLTINSIKALDIMLSYGEVKFPKDGYPHLAIDIKEPHSIHFPDNFKVYGSMFIYGDYIQDMSGDLTVTQQLSLSNSSVRSLPEKLSVYGNLYIDNTEIIEWPNKLVVWKDVIIGYHSLIEDLPTSARIGGRVKR